MTNKILRASCFLCRDEMVSKDGGHFVSCRCGESYIDRDRWFPDERYRVGGDAVGLEWIVQKDENTTVHTLIHNSTEIEPEKGEVYQVNNRKQTTMRVFDTGATRDTEVGKLDFEGFLSPHVLHRFAEYMHKHRQMPDGSMRDSDNWQLGISDEVYMKSMTRHFMAVWQYHRSPTIKNSEEQIENLCALLFNVQGMLHNIERQYHIQ